MESRLIIPVEADFSKADAKMLAYARHTSDIFEKKGFKLNIRKPDLPLGRITGDFEKFQGSLDAATARVLAFTATTTVIYGLSTAFNRLFTDSVKLEKQLAGIQAILNTSNSGLQQFGAELFELANATGLSFDIAATAASEFARQGLSLEETLKATNAALVFSKIAGVNAAIAVENLTASVNTFSNEALILDDVSDIILSLDNAFAISAAGISDGLKRIGGVASESGLQLKEIASLISVVQQVSARGAPVISNGLKTIFTRLGRTKVQETLNGIGIATQNSNGEFRSQIDVLSDLSSKLETLSDSQRAFVLEQVAGVYQINTLQSTLKALSGEYSLYDKAVKIASDSAGNSAERLKILTATTDASIQRLKNNITQFLAETGKATVKPILDNFLGIGNKILESLNLGAAVKGGEEAGFSIGNVLLNGISAALSGPGTILLVVTVARLLNKITKDAFSALQTLAGLKKASLLDNQTQNSINQAIAQGNQGLVQRLATTTSIVEQTRILNNLLSTQSQTKGIAQIQQAVSVGLAANKVNVPAKAKQRSKGYMPNYALGNMPSSVPQAQEPIPPEIKRKEKMDSLGGRYKSGEVKQVPEGYMSTAEFRGVIPGGGPNPWILPPLTQNGKPVKAGEDFREKAIRTKGIDPYKAAGFIPNFAFDIGSFTGVGGLNRVNNPKATEQFDKGQKGNVEWDDKISSVGFRIIKVPFDFNKTEAGGGTKTGKNLPNKKLDRKTSGKNSAEEGIKFEDTALSYLNGPPFGYKFKDGSLSLYGKKTSAVDGYSINRGGSAKTNRIQLLEAKSGDWTPAEVSNKFGRFIPENINILESSLSPFFQEGVPNQFDTIRLENILAVPEVKKPFEKDIRNRYRSSSFQEMEKERIIQQKRDEAKRERKKIKEGQSVKPKKPVDGYKAFVQNLLKGPAPIRAEGFIPNFVRASSMIGRGAEGSFHKLTEDIGVKRFHRSARGRNAAPYDLTETIKSEFAISKLLARKKELVPGITGPKIPDKLNRALQAGSIRKQIIKEPLARDSVGREASLYFGQILRSRLSQAGLLMDDLHGSNYTLNAQGQEFINKNKFKWKSSLKNLMYSSSSSSSSSSFSSMRPLSPLLTPGAKKDYIYDQFVKSGGKATIIDAGFTDVINPNLKKQVSEYRRKTNSKGFIPNFNKEFFRDVVGNKESGKNLARNIDRKTYDFLIAKYGREEVESNLAKISKTPAFDFVSEEDKKYKEAVQKNNTDLLKKMLAKKAEDSGFNRKGVRLGFYNKGVPLPPEIIGPNFGPGYYTAEDASLSLRGSDVSVNQTPNKNRLNELGLKASDVKYRQDEVYVKAQKPLMGNLPDEFVPYLNARVNYETAVNDAYSKLGKYGYLDAADIAKARGDSELLSSLRGKSADNEKYKVGTAILMKEGKIPYDSIRGIGGRTLQDKRMSSELVVQNASQIKSAALVEYDDDGNLIPLSKRFDETSDDIRGSKNPKKKRGRGYSIQSPRLRGKPASFAKGFIPNFANPFSSRITSSSSLRVMPGAQAVPPPAQSSRIILPPKPNRTNNTETVTRNNSNPKGKKEIAIDMFKGLLKAGAMVYARNGMLGDATNALTEGETDNMVALIKGNAQWAKAWMGAIGVNRFVADAAKNGLRVAGSLQKALTGRNRTSAEGFIPNFSSPLSYTQERKAVNESIGAEMTSGYKRSEVYLGRRSSLKTDLNPQGLAVFNKDEGTLSKGMSFAKMAKQDPTTKRTYGDSSSGSESMTAALGFIPNFATSKEIRAQKRAERAQRKKEQREKAANLKPTKVLPSSPSDRTGSIAFGNKTTLSAPTTSKNYFSSPLGSSGQTSTGSTALGNTISKNSFSTGSSQPLKFPRADPFAGLSAKDAYNKRRSFNRLDKRVASGKSINMPRIANPIFQGKNERNLNQSIERKQLQKEEKAKAAQRFVTRDNAKLKAVAESKRFNTREDRIAKVLERRPSFNPKAPALKKEVNNVRRSLQVKEAARQKFYGGMGVNLQAGTPQAGGQQGGGRQGAMPMGGGMPMGAGLPVSDTQATKTPAQLKQERKEIRANKASAMSGKMMGAAFVASSVTGMLTTPAEGQEQTKVQKIGQNVGESIATGASVAMAAAMAPALAPVIIPLALLGAGLKFLHKANKDAVPSTVELTKNNKKLAESTASQITSVQEAVKAQGEISQLKESGGDPKKIAQAQAKFNKSLGGIKDKELISTLVNEKSDTKKQEAIMAFQEKKTKELNFSTGDLATNEIIKKSRLENTGILGTKTKTTDFGSENWDTFLNPIIDSIDFTKATSKEASAAIGKLGDGTMSMGDFISQFGSELGLSESQVKMAKKTYGDLNNQFTSSSVQAMDKYAAALLDYNKSINETATKGIKGFSLDFQKVFDEGLKGLTLDTALINYQKFSKAGTNLGIDKNRLEIAKSSGSITEEQSITKSAEIETRQLGLENEKAGTAIVSDAVSKLTALVPKDVSIEKRSAILDQASSVLKGGGDLSSLENIIKQSLGAGDSSKELLSQIADINQEVVLGIEKLRIDQAEGVRSINTIAQDQLKESQRRSVAEIGKAALAGPPQYTNKLMNTGAVMETDAKIQKLRDKAEKSGGAKSAEGRKLLLEASNLEMQNDRVKYEDELAQAERYGKDNVVKRTSEGKSGAAQIQRNMAEDIGNKLRSLNASREKSGKAGIFSNEDIKKISEGIQIGGEGATESKRLLEEKLNNPSYAQDATVQGFAREIKDVGGKNSIFAGNAMAAAVSGPEKSLAQATGTPAIPTGPSVSSVTAGATAPVVAGTAAAGGGVPTLPSTTAVAAGAGAVAAVPTAIASTAMNPSSAALPNYASSTANITAKSLTGRGSEQADRLRRAAAVTQTQDYKSFEEERLRNQTLRQERDVAKAGKVDRMKDNNAAAGKIKASTRFTQIDSTGTGSPNARDVLIQDLADFQEKLNSGDDVTQTEFENLKASTLKDESGNARSRQEVATRNAYISQVESSGFKFTEDSDTIKKRIEEVQAKKEEKAQQGLDTKQEDTQISNLQKRDTTLNQDYDAKLLESDTRLAAKKERIDAAVSAAEGYNTDSARFLTEEPKIVTKTKSKTPEEMDSQVKRLQGLEQTAKLLGDGKKEDERIQRVEQDLREGKQVLGKDGKIERVKMSPEQVAEAQKQLAGFKEDKNVNTVARQNNKRETARLKASVAEDPVQYLKSLQKQRGSEPIQNTSRIDDDIKRSQDNLKNGALGQGEDGKVKLTPLSPEERKDTEEYIKKRMADKKEAEAKNQPLIEIDNKIKAATAQAQMSDPKGYVELLRRKAGPSKGTPEDLKKGIQSKKDEIASLEKINPIPSDKNKEKIDSLRTEIRADERSLSQEQLIAEAQKKADVKDPAKIRTSYVEKLRGSKDKNLQGVAAKIDKLDKNKAELASLKGTTLTVDDEEELKTLQDEVESFGKADSNRKELDQLRMKGSAGTLTESDQERKKQLEGTQADDAKTLATEITPQKKARMQELQGKEKNTKRQTELKGEIKKGTEDVARATDQNMGAINSELFKGQVAPIIMDQIQKPQDKAKVEAFNAKVVERQDQEAQLNPVNKNIADIEAKRKERGKVANAAIGFMGEDKDGKKQEFINKFTRGEITAQEANEQTGGALKKAYDTVIPKKEGEKFEDLNNVGNIKDEKAKKALLEKNIATAKKEEDTLGAAIKPLIDAVANLTNAQGAVTEAAAAFQNAQGAQGAEGGVAAAATTNINSTSQVNVNITGEDITPEIIEKLKPAILAIIAEHSRAAASEAGKPPPASPPPKSPPVTTP